MDLETVAPAIDAVRSRRADLHGILVDLEKAIAAAAPGREEGWAELVQATLGRLREALAEHITGTEGPNGLFEKVRRRSPRLDVNCTRLAAEHGAITVQLGAAEAALEEGTEPARSAVLELLAQLARHRQAGADLVYEAYAVDIGGSD